MATGTRGIDRPLAEVRDRLRLLLAAANCEIAADSGEVIEFRHGTNITQTASMIRKRGTLRLSERDGTTQIDYEVRPSGFLPGYMTVLAVVFCWTIFAPLLVHRALVYHPRRFMENLLDGI